MNTTKPTSLKIVALMNSDETLGHLKIAVEKMLQGLYYQPSQQT